MTSSQTPLRSPQSILVTGGCGFIGSAYIRYLFSQPSFKGRVVNLDLLTYAANPENVAGAVDEQRYVLARGDICDETTVEKLCDEHGIDAIVNFAAESHVDRSIHGPAVFIQTNVVGTFHLLEVVRRRPNIHFHHVSTDEVYGSLGPTGAFREDNPYEPNSPYSASKAASDHLVRAYTHTYGLSTTLSNCSNNYGPYQFPEKLIPLMLLNMLEGKPLPVYGDGSNIRDWLHVDDHAMALNEILLRGARGGTYNIGGDSERTNMQVIDQLIQIVSELAGKSEQSLRSLITFVKDRPGHDRRYAIDCSKIKRELGWSQTQTFESGLRQTVAWYLENSRWVERVRTGAYREWLGLNYGAR